MRKNHEMIRFTLTMANKVTPKNLTQRTENRSIVYVYVLQTVRAWCSICYVRILYFIVSLQRINNEQQYKSCLPSVNNYFWMISNGTCGGCFWHKIVNHISLSFTFHGPIIRNCSACSLENFCVEKCAMCVFSFFSVLFLVTTENCIWSKTKKRNKTN